MDFSSLILEARNLSNDNSTSNLSRAEVPQRIRNGINKVFELARYPIVTGSVLFTSGTGIIRQAFSGYGTVDNTNGLLTFTTAPTGTEDPWFVDYNWYWNSDAEYTTFFNQGIQDIGSSPTATSVEYGLQAALVQFALYYAYKERAAKYANRYASGGGGVSHGVDIVVKNFLNLADNAIKCARQLRSDYYTRYDAQKQAYSGDPNAQGNYLQVDPYTPRR